jgi:hypothetical protein
MAHPAASTLSRRALGRPLTASERRGLRRDVARLLAWQRDLGSWPLVAHAPDGIPFVSLYARGRLVGCFGSDEGPPPERLARAFLRALEDARFGGVRAPHRAELSCDVAYVTDLRDVEPDAIEAGTDGVGVVRPDGAPIVLLPEVASYHRLDVKGLLDRLADKAGLDLHARRLFAFTTDRVSVHAGARATSPRDPRDEAARWLARQVQEDGSVVFAVDPRGRRRAAQGAMHHGRVAVALRALEAHGGHGRATKRARARLEKDLDALSGGEPAQTAGTLALAALAGIPVRAALLERARGWREVAKIPWHAAQVVAALGKDAPEPLWRACARDLDTRPWAPWTAIAAHNRGDGAVLARVAPALVASLRASSPHRGGAGVTAVPEIALTALTVEALALVDAPDARAAARRGRAFLARWQIRRGEVPARLDPTMAAGAFPASPVADLLRVDITAHALLALA